MPGLLFERNTRRPHGPLSEIAEFAKHHHGQRELGSLEDVWFIIISLRLEKSWVYNSYCEDVARQSSKVSYNEKIDIAEYKQCAFVALMPTWHGSSIADNCIG